MQTQFHGKSWRNPNPSRQLDGLSQPMTRSLDSMDDQELKMQYEKTSAMLNNTNLKLPDGGAKLKAKLNEIQKLLDTRKVNESNTIADKVSELSLDDPSNIRKQVLNQKDVHPTKLLRAHSSEDSQMEDSHSGTRMLSLEESMKLQEAQQKDIKLANMRRKMDSIRGSVTSESLADDLSLTMNSLRLDPETRQPRPQDDNPEDFEGGDADSDDDDDTDSDYNGEDDGMGGYERYDDEGFEEEDEAEFEDGQQYNNNNRRI